MKTKTATLLLSFGLFSYVSFRLSFNIVSVVKDNGLLPLWDQATHAMEGWEVYYYLKHLNLPMFAWKLWTRGLWPFVHNLYLTIFYFIFGPYYQSALISSIVAFSLIGVLSSYLLIKINRSSFLFPVSIMIFFLFSSPMYLAYSTLSMLEIFGSLIEICVFISYILLNEKKDYKSANIFALSLTILFFTKFNYFFLVFVPILINEYLIYTQNWTHKDHFENFFKNAHFVMSNTLGKILLVYCSIIIFIIKIGGFEIYIFNQKISVHGVESNGYIILYALLWKIWTLHKKGIIKWNYIFDIDYRIRSLVYFFGIPLLIWFSIPYPNHMKDFFGFLINKKTENLSFLEGISYYISILKNEYFFNDFTFIAGTLIYFISLLQYKNRDRLEKYLILTSIIQIIMIFFHQFKEARFIFPALIPIWLVICIEINYWIKKNTIFKHLSVLLSILCFYCSIVSFNHILHNGKITNIVLGSYSRNKGINSSFDWIRNLLNKEDSLAILGSSNMLSPALFFWHLGPPEGYLNYIGTIKPNRYGKLDKCSRIILIEPIDENADKEIVEKYNSHYEHIQQLLNKNKIAYFDELKVESLYLVFRAYKSLKE